MKLLRFSLKVTNMDRIRNYYVRRKAQAEQFGEKVTNARLRCFDADEGLSIYWTKMLNIKLPGWNKRGKSQRGFMDLGHLGHAECW